MTLFWRTITSPSVSPNKAPWFNYTSNAVLSIQFFQYLQFIVFSKVTHDYVQWWASGLIIKTWGPVVTYLSPPPPLTTPYKFCVPNFEVRIIGARTSGSVPTLH
jgi:hypothetical protein